MSTILSPGVKWSQYPDGGSIVSGDTLVGYRGNVNTRFDASTLLSPTSLILPVTQANAFVVGNVVRLNGATFVLAQADSAAHANVFGIVSGIVTPGSVFNITLAGIVNTLAGLVAGSVYYLSPAVAGLMTVTAPVAPGQIYKPLLIAQNATSGVWLNYQGNQL